MDLRLPTPDASGFADSNGVRIAWEAFGSGPSTVLVIPTWNFVDSRVSANLVPDLARVARVVTYDPRGAGRSDRPATGYRAADHKSDALAVLAAVGADRVSVIAGSSGANPAALLAVEQPDRVERLILIAPAVLVPPEAPSPDDAFFWVERDRYEGWDRWSAPYWRQDWPAFARWFLELVFNEPDSEPLVEAMLRIALEADPEVLIQQHRDGRAGGDSVAVRDILETIAVPTLIVHGRFDDSVALTVAEALHGVITGSILAVALEGGHRPDIRSPELINPLLAEFLAGGR